MPSFPKSSGIYSYALCSFDTDPAICKSNWKTSCQFLLLSACLMMLYLIFRSLTDLGILIFQTTFLQQEEESNPSTIAIKLTAQFIRCFYASLASLSLCIILRYVLYNHSNPIIGYLYSIRRLSNKLILFSFTAILIFSYLPHLLFAFVFPTKWSDHINELFVVPIICDKYLECTYFDDNIHLFFHDNFGTIIFCPFLFASIYCVCIKCKHQTVLDTRSSNLELALLDRNSVMEFTTFTVHHLSEDVKTNDEERRNTIRAMNESMDEVIAQHENSYIHCILFLCVFIMHRFVYCILKDVKEDLIEQYVIAYFILIIAFYAFSKASLKKTARICDEIIVVKYHEYIKKLVNCRDSKLEIPEYNVLSLEFLMECYVANIYYNFHRKLLFLYIDTLSNLMIVFFINLMLIEMIQSVSRISIRFFNHYEFDTKTICKYKEWLVRIFMDLICRFYACLFSGVFMILSVFFETKQMKNSALHTYCLLFVGLEVVIYSVIIFYINCCLDVSGMDIFIRYLQRNKSYIGVLMAFMMITVVL